jgi:hypothetical protein
MKRENISKAFLKENKKIKEEENNILNEKKRQKVMKEIELKTEKKIVTGLATGEITNPILEKNTVKQQNNEVALLSILSNSSNEFKEKMGRNMTYGEMRAMYG